MKRDEFRQRAGQALRTFGRVVTRNFGLKLLSVACTLLLWTYVVSSTSSITREKTLYLDIGVTGETELSGRNLALLTDVNHLDTARVRVRVPQANYSLVTGENVRVVLDLSSVRSTGKQSVRLRGSTSYGTVVDVWPEYVDLEVENRDQRYVPVNAQITGGQEEGYWYSVQRVNPTQVTVTGPTSIVQNVSSAQVALDVTGRTESHSRVEGFTLLDTAGNEITQTLSRSTSSVTVSMEIYPTREIQLADQPSDLLTGQIPEGYRVAGVEISPAALTAAGEQSLLDSLSEIRVEPVDISEHNKSFSALTQVHAVKGLRYLSAEEALVSVTIEEEQHSRVLPDVQINLTALPEGMSVAPEATVCDVRVTGLYSVVNSLTQEDVRAWTSLAGLGEGAHMVNLSAQVDEYPDLETQAIPGTIRVVLTREQTD